MLKDTYRLLKPGIIYGNAIPAVAGYLLASGRNIIWLQALAMLLGLSLVIGAGCVTNNIIDRDIDMLMERTRKRALVTGTISVFTATVLAVLLGAAGLAVLLLGTNLLATAIAAVGFVFYVLFYSLLTKRTTVFGTHVGSIAGAVPPVVGYASASGHLDSAALILFLILIFWQMPHFFAIGLFRKTDYLAAKLPILPVRASTRRVQYSILGYIVAFSVVVTLLTPLGYASIAYAVAAGLIGLSWVAVALWGLRTHDVHKWARRTFLWSLLSLTAVCVAISVSALVAPTKSSKTPPHYVPTYVLRSSVRSGTDVPMVATSQPPATTAPNVKTAGAPLA